MCDITQGDHNASWWCHIKCYLQGQMPTKLTLKQFYRPEDISIELAYQAELYEVYASEETKSVDVESLVAKCFVAPEPAVPGLHTQFLLSFKLLLVLQCRLQTLVILILQLLGLVAEQSMKYTQV